MASESDLFRLKSGAVIDLGFSQVVKPVVPAEVPAKRQLVLVPKAVPLSSPWLSVRDALGQKRYERLRHSVYEVSAHRCTVCGGESSSMTGWPVACHPVFTYNADTGVQVLEAFTALCGPCIAAHSASFLGGRGTRGLTFQNLMRLNGLSSDQTLALRRKAFAVYLQRNELVWQLDASLLDAYQ